MENSTEKDISELELARQFLIKLAQQYGSSLDRDPKKLESKLSELCGDKAKSEIILLCKAAEKGIPQTILMYSRNSMLFEKNMTELIKLLQDKNENIVEIEEIYARWAVESWALAYGVKIIAYGVKIQVIEVESQDLKLKSDLHNSPRFNWKIILGTGATLFILVLGGSFLFRQSKSTPTVSVPTSISPSSTLSISSIAGEYKIVLNPLVSSGFLPGGKCTIKSEGTFECAIKFSVREGEEKEINFEGEITIKDGKVVFQQGSWGLDKLNDFVGVTYKLSPDGKELLYDSESDNQFYNYKWKLVKQ